VDRSVFPSSDLEHPTTRIVLLGPPGVGKGTQGWRLSHAEQVPLLSTGDILRAAVQEGTPLGRQAQRFMARGELVPDRLVDDLMATRLLEDDVRDGFILDGYPRTLAQAEALTDMLGASARELFAAVLFEVPDHEVIRRISGRRTCPVCGRIYHVVFDPPREAERCDADGRQLVRREDDHPRTIRTRLAVYHRESRPMIAYYAELELLAPVYAAGSPDDVWAQLGDALGAARSAR
jgi:adenylate kinase